MILYVFIPMKHNIRKWWKRWERRNPRFTKRQEFVLGTAVLTLGLVLTQLVPIDWRYPMVVSLSVAAGLVVALVLREDLKEIEWVTLLALPVLFTGSVSSFYFLLPVRWLTRVPVAALYAIAIYGLFLTLNIYNVSANRTIALLRAAHTVGFLLTLITFFLLTHTILAFRFSGLANMSFLVLCGAILILQSLWSVELEARISRRVWQLTGALTLSILEIGWILSFWPVRSTLQALFLTTFAYSLLGMAQQYLANRMYKRTLIEFFAVTIIVLIIVMITTNWRELL